MRVSHLIAFALVALSGCADDSTATGEPTGPTTTTTSGTGAGGEGGVGGGSDGGGGMGGAPAESEPTSPAEVLQQGSADLLLRGVVLTPTGVLDPGEVLIEGDTIVCVAADCTTETAAAGATWIQTNGIISPGFIDGHNHIAYNFLPEWEPNMSYLNRYEWADDPDYESHILPYSANRSSNSHFCPGAKWGEIRSLMHGTTTVQGQPSASGSCIDWGVRNAQRYHGLGYDHMRTTIASVRDLDDDDAAGLIADFDAPTEPVTRYVVHMAEGTDGNNLLAEFDSFAGRDPRPNRHNGTSLLYNGTSVLIHSLPLTEPQLQEAAANDAKIVWSPSSNFALYGDGETAPIERILELGIVTSIGPDWTISGEDEMLSELRVAQGYALQEGIVALTPQRLWEMATVDGAIVVGLEDFIGTLEVGKRGDVVVLGRTGADPYQAVLDSRVEDVRLVAIDGQVFFGDSNLETDTARNSFCESFDGCGTAKFVCVQDDPSAPNRRDETLAEIETQLFNILEGIGYPANEQYGRGNELQPLAQCF